MNSYYYSNKISRLEDHHLCTLLGGHFSAITNFAPYFKQRSLWQFYKVLLKMFDQPDLVQDMNEIGSIHSLKVSLEANTKHLEDQNPEAAQLFGMMGLMPGGAYETCLTAIW